MKNERVVRLLAFLADGAWNTRTPAGVGPRTVAYCIERGWVQSKLLTYRQPDGVEGFFVTFRVTKLGKIEHMAEEERTTGRMHPELREHRLRELRVIIGSGAVHSLQLGAAVLKCWSMTVPPNKWVENRRGKILWHSGEWSKFLPIEPFFEVIEHSKETPWLSIYRLEKCYC